ncbi:MAG: IPTL-CTERM sorting domain-containing protein [Desulfobacteraceae bacterium]|nr:MAG: IPTL-CTERM sorting domain-containing protein [Desulfobacteraceae bacterium]
MKKISLILTLMFSLYAFSPANAGNILFVSDDGSDNNIDDALAVDGHNITSETDRAVLLGNLNDYCCVFWSASDDGEQNLSSVVANLTNYVSNGGFVFVTGGDAVAAPPEPNMLNFVGASSSLDAGNIIGPVLNSQNSLTYGVIDIRGQVPPNISDADTLCSPLTSGTVGIATSDANCGDGSQGYEWTLRSLGKGKIAFVSSGNFDNDNDDPLWTDTSIPGDGVFNAALRNFAYNACRPSSESIPTMNEWGLIILSLLLAGSAFWMIRRQAA